MTTQAVLGPIRYYLPNKVLTNAELAAEFPEWPAERIEEKTGIVERRIAASGEFASDLACGAARLLFAEAGVSPADIDYLILCTQSPDYPLPTTACLVQHRLGLGTGTAAVDINLGCSGFVYGLGLAKGVVESGLAKCVLLLTADTYSKYLDPTDKSVRTLFGDAGAAAVVRAGPANGSDPAVGPFVFGTDGSGANALIVRAGRPGWTADGEDVYLRMSGPDVFSFTLNVVPPCVRQLLDKAGLSLNDIDLFVFHQANKYMLEQLRRKIGIPSDKFLISMSHCGNTVSSTIPIALRDAEAAGRLSGGQRVMVVGFGVGLSWAAALVRWPATPNLSGSHT
jgi:3-oxoacyl-[acyl-carrier-protein] synthase-3